MRADATFLCPVNVAMLYAPHVDVCTHMRASTAGLPLVSLMLLTCNRPAFLRLSLVGGCAKYQTEVIVVNDSVDIRRLGAIAVRASYRSILCAWLIAAPSAPSGTRRSRQIRRGANIGAAATSTAVTGAIARVSDRPKRD